MKMSRAPRTLAAFSLGLALASGPLAACGTPDPNEPVTEDVYCADENGKVIPESYCDDDYRGPGGGFIWIGGFGSGRAPGYVLPRDRMSDRVPYNDPVARQKAGLPAKGRVTGSGGLGGTVTRTRATAPNAGKGTGSGTKVGTGSKGGGFGSGGSKGGSGS